MSILIKKYSNRRLYNTEEKRYITQEDLMKMIQQGQEVSIIDNDTKKDITEETLMQIILNNFQGLFSSTLLHQLIRLQGKQLQDFLPFYLRTGLEYFFQFGGQPDLWKQMSPSTMMAHFLPFNKGEKNTEESKKKSQKNEKKVEDQNKD
ncbi:MAG: hypothetical protein HUU50_16240 [Candidatus Brocadiae bacterium]|nr:hypothetical protein [Candidatus Brocadiia bacterium]